MITPDEIQNAIDHPSPTMQKAIAKNRAMQADLRKEYAAYIAKQKAKFERGNMSMILPTYSEWLRYRMKRKRIYENDEIMAKLGREIIDRILGLRRAGKSDEQIGTLLLTIGDQYIDEAAGMAADQDDT